MQTKKEKKVNKIYKYSSDFYEITIINLIISSTMHKINA